MALLRGQGRTNGGVAALAVFVALSASSPGHAADAGTRITNIATVRYQAGTTALVADSNSVSLIVAERLDLTLTRTATGPLGRAEATPVPIVLTNTGNGHEAFDVRVTGVSNATVAIDRDGDGRYEPARDTLLTAGRTPDLAPGGTLALIVVADTATVPTGGGITIMAVAVTGSGAAGTMFAGQGDGGGDAVVGVTGAAATLVVPVDTAAPPTLTKTQSVLAPDGGSQPVRGAIVTYVLEAGFVAAADDARIDDPVPAGTRYVPGSLRLDGVTLADAGDGTAVHVALGPVPGPATHRIQFQVQIQ